jgi:peroxiredoxin
MSEDADPASGAPERSGPPPAPDAAPAAPEGAAPAPAPLGLDPDLAAAAARRARGRSGQPPSSPRGVPAGKDEVPAAPVIDTRRYRWIIGVLGLIIVIVISAVSFLQHGVVSTGVPAHERLRYFAAPLAGSNLNGSANVGHPTCDPAKHDPRALNVCLLVKRGPLVLAFFVTGARQCTQEVDAMQVVSRQIPSVQFAAVAVDASHAATAKVLRTHGWTIPVAYDADGAVGYQYGVDVCPLVELAYRGGIVQDRLIGDHWARPAVLAQRVRALLASQPR